MDLIRNLEKQGWLNTPRIIRAFEKIDRADFMPPGEKELAGIDEAMPIGCGQTISQPLVVAFMIELLSPKEGERILDIGSGSGWTSAILAELVGEKGLVMAIEIIPELVEFGKKNISKYPAIKQRVRIINADGADGYNDKAPYDKILCSAMVHGEIPREWESQLKLGGRIVAPIDSSIWLFVKEKGGFRTREYPGFVFVPLVSDKS